ncbi:MAG: 2OG-Fe(II) oxygenase [Acidobacteriaceae bacterium]
MVAYDVFTADFYSWLDRAYVDLLAMGLSEGQEAGRLSRNISNYDVYNMSLSPDTRAPFNVFTSPEWHNMLANLVGIRVTGDINAGFHHHSVQSKSGRVHNDFNPGWFADAAYPNEVNVSRNDICEYSSGKAFGAHVRVHQTVRAIAVLYYFHNPTWTRGQGGETGLYSDFGQPVAEPSKAVPPISNSLLLFECCPTSFHTFLSNRTAPRNSMIMWLHRPVKDAARRWGEDSIVQWKNAPKN